MAGLVPAIHAAMEHTAAWMPGARPGMTMVEWVQRDFADRLD